MVIYYYFMLPLPYTMDVYNGFNKKVGFTKSHYLFNNCYMFVNVI